MADARRQWNSHKRSQATDWDTLMITLLPRSAPKRLHVRKDVAEAVRYFDFRQRQPTIFQVSFEYLRFKRRISQARIASADSADNLLLCRRCAIKSPMLCVTLANACRPVQLLLIGSRAASFKRPLLPIDVSVFLFVRDISLTKRFRVSCPIETLTL